MTPSAPLRGSGAGQAKSWTAPVQRFELGGQTITNHRMRIADFDAELHDVDMLIGIDYFLAHRIYVANSQQRLYITYNGGPVFSNNPGVGTDAGADGAKTESDAPLADADAYARRGMASAARRHFERALADLNRACELAPQTAHHFTRRGAVHMELKQWPQAGHDFNTALALDAEQHQARLQRATLRATAGEREAALQDLRVLDEKLAAQADLRRDMATIYMSMALPDRALPQLNHWIAVRRDRGDLDAALNERCWARAMLGVELDRALDDCTAAVESSPRNAAFLDSRAWVRLRRGELREAVADYERALEIDPAAAWSLYGRGLARRRLGDTDKGSADIDKARQLLPTIDAETGRYGLGADTASASRTP